MKKQQNHLAPASGCSFSRLPITKVALRHLTALLVKVEEERKSDTKKYRLD